MRILILLYILIIFTSPNLAQKKISSYIGENSNSKNQVRAINGKKYLISFQQSDEIKVMEVHSLDSITFLHKQVFHGIFDNRDIEVNSKHLIFENNNNIVIYDFINNSLITHPIEYPYDYFNIFKINGYSAFVSIKDLDGNWQKYYLDFETGLEQHAIDGIITQRKDEHLVLYKYHPSTELQSYSVYNYITGEENKLITNATNRHKISLGESSVYYQDEIGRLMEFSYVIGIPTEITGVNTHYGFSNDIQVFGNNIYKYNYTQGNIHIQIVDLETKERTQNLTIETNYAFQNHFYIYEDNIVAKCSNNILIINTISGEHRFFKQSGIQDDITILEDGKILCYSYLFGHGKVFEHIDIATRTSEIVIGDYDIWSYAENYIKIGNNYVGSFFDNVYGSSLYAFNMDNFTYYPANDLDRTNTGFSDKSKVVLLNDQVILMANNLYKVVGDTLIQVNTGEIVPGVVQRYREDNGKIYFIEKVANNSLATNFYSYDGNQLVHEAQLNNIQPNFILDYAIVGNYLYFYDYLALKKYNLSSKVTNIIEEEIITHGWQSGLTLNVHEEYFYYVSYQGYKRIRNGENPQLLESDDLIRFNDFFTLRDRLFMSGDEGLAEVVENELITIIKDSTEHIVNITRKDIIDKNLIFYNRNIIQCYDGNSVSMVDNSLNKPHFVWSFGDGMFVLHEFKNGPNQFAIYNSETKTKIHVLEGKEEERLAGVFYANQDTFMTTIIGDKPKKLRIYSVIDNFQNMTLLGEYNDVGRLNDATFHSFGNEGLLYSGDILFLMDDHLGFHVLDNIKGSYKTPEIIEKEGTIYFLAIDNTEGRQLYKTDLFSSRSTPPQPTILKDIHDISTCISEIIDLEIEYNFADSIQWMVKKPLSNQYEAIHDDNAYSGTTSNILHINTLYTQNRNKYQCAIYYYDSLYLSNNALVSIIDITVSDAGQDETICNNTTVLTANNPDQGLGMWSIIEGSANIIDETSSTTTITNLSDGINKFRWTIFNDECINFDEIIISKIDSLTIIKEPIDVMTTIGESVEFEAIPNVDYISAQWYKDGVLLIESEEFIGVKTEKLTINDVKENHEGIYYSIFEGYCNSLESKSATLELELNSNNIDNTQINLYPNPVKNYLYINSQLELESITVHTLEGQLINLDTTNLISFSGFSSGVYIITIRTKSTLSHFKIVKI